MNRSCTGLSIRKRGILWLLACLLAIPYLSARSYADAERQLPRYVRLVILHTNDVHGHMFPFSYGDEKDVGGVARRATMIEEMRSQCKDALLVLDAGDVFTRGPLANAYKGEPDIAVLNAIGYDALAIGNNEYKGDEGLAGQKIMFERIKQVQFPVLCGNCTYKDTGKPIVPPFTIIQQNGLKVGIFSVTAPRAATYPQAEGLSIEDPIQAAERIVPTLKNEADVIVALTHIGYDLDKQLAAQVPDIDIIVGGDSHTWLYHPELIRASSNQDAFWVGGPIIVQDGEWGKCLGELTAVLRLQGEHDYQVMSYTGELVPVTSTTQPSKKIESLLTKYSKPFEKVIGESDRSLSKAEMDAWMADVFRSIGKAQVGISQVGNCENVIEKGPITRLDLMMVPVYDNMLVTGQISGKTLRVLMSDKTVVVRGIEQVDGNAAYSVCTQDFLTLTIPAFKDLKFQPLGMTIREALEQYVTRQQTTN